jgi:hypothetical protein
MLSPKSGGTTEKSSNIYGVILSEIPVTGEEDGVMSRLQSGQELCSFAHGLMQAAQKTCVQIFINALSYHLPHVLVVRVYWFRKNPDK